MIFPACVSRCADVLRACGFLSVHACGALTLFITCSQVVKVAGVSLWALFREKKEKPRN